LKPKLSKIKTPANQFEGTPVAANKSERRFSAPLAPNSLELAPGGSVHPGPLLPTTNWARVVRNRKKKNKVKTEDLAVENV
jgi:hypothetical protein